MMEKNKILIPLFLFLTLFAANAGVSQDQPFLPEPTLLLNAGDYGEIPVYDEFSDLEPVFNQQSDITYVINFWATWCKPCVEELPYFEQLKESASGENIRVILVSLDFPKQLETKLVPFVQEQQLKSEVVVLLDGSYNDWIDKVSPEWSGAIPVTVIYKGSNRQFIGRQFHDAEELKTAVMAVKQS